MNIDKILNILTTQPAIIREHKKQYTWEDYVSIGIEARTFKDKSQWILGDLANEVCQISWGGKTDREHTVKEYAKDIGMNAKTLGEYARVARIFPEPKRIPILSFRHHQIVSKLENAQEWLEKAANELWSTEKLMAEIQQFKSNQQQGLEQDLKNRVFLVESDQQQPGTISIVYNPVNKIDEVSLNTTIKQIIKKILEKEDNLKEKNEIK